MHEEMKGADNPSAEAVTFRLVEILDPARRAGAGEP
jgi:hypothetical protein